MNDLPTAPTTPLRASSSSPALGPTSPLGTQHLGSPTAAPGSASASGNGDTLAKVTAAVGDQASRLASQIRTGSQKVADEASHVAREARQYVTSHPVSSGLTTLGLGLAAGYLLYQWLKPEPTPRQRALSLLEDIRESLGEIAASSVESARDGAGAVKRGAGSVADTIRHLFS